MILYPGVQVGLEFIQRVIQPSPEGNPMKFVQDRFVETLADPIPLRMPRLDLTMLNAVHAKIAFVIVPLDLPAIFRTSVCRDADDAHFLREEESKPRSSKRSPVMGVLVV